MFTPYTLFSRPTATPTVYYRIEPKIAKSSTASEAAPPYSVTAEFNPVIHIDVRVLKEDASLPFLL
jgi:hypothetical protein